MVDRKRARGGWGTAKWSEKLSGRRLPSAPYPTRIYGSLVNLGQPTNSMTERTILPQVGLGPYLPEG